MELLVRPLNTRLAVTHGQNLLDVLRQNAIPISYSCMSGRCGTCRCTVLAGAAPQGAPELSRDSPPAGAEVLACQYEFTHSCTVEIPEIDEVITHPAKIIKATVAAIEPLTADIVRLRVRPAKPMAFSSGQYAMLTFTPDHVRPYSWAGLPEDAEMEFQVRLAPQGKVTEYVFKQLAVGDNLRMSGPLGTAYLRQKHSGPLLCVGGGTGIAPIVSIVRGAIASSMPNPIHLYFGVRNPADVYDAKRLQALAAAHGAMTVHVVVASGDVQSGQRSGLLTDAIMADFQSLQGFCAYFCGAPAMVDALRAMAIGLGIAAPDIHADAFYPAPVELENTNP